MTRAESPPIRLIRAEVDVRAYHRWAASRRMTAAAFDHGHAMHCLLTESFGPDMAPRPFRLMMPRDDARAAARPAVLYGYAHADAGDLKEAAQRYADPLQHCALGIDDLLDKPMPTQWRTGQRLGFETLVRPTVRRSNNAEVIATPKGNIKAGIEIDAYLLEAARHPMGEMKRSREEVYAGWLKDQFQRHGGAQVESVRLRSFQRIRSIRKMDRKPIEGPHAIMAGNLVIENPEAFTNLLNRGIGRHRAYGYGMLLLRPPTSPESG